MALPYAWVAETASEGVEAVRSTMGNRRRGWLRSGAGCGYTGSAMPSVPGTSRARRSDVRVFLILGAASLLLVAGFILGYVSTGGGLFSTMFEHAREKARAGNWAGSLWNLVWWFSWDPGALVPPLIVVAGALRFCSRRATTVAVATYSVSAVLVLWGAIIRDACAWGALGPGSQTTVSVANCVIGAASWLGPAVVPVAVLLASWRWREVLLVDPPWRAARLTRAVLLAMAVAWGISMPVLQAAGIVNRRIAGLPEHLIFPNIIMSLAGVQLVAALAIVLCAVLLVRGWALSSRTLRTALLVDLARSVVVGGGLLYYYHVTIGSPWWNLANLSSRPENTLPLSAVLLWYWWPAIRGRADVDLSAGAPICERCGYDLTGNPLGPCPECGEGVKVPGAERR